jgi:hexosaminidase
MDGWLTVDSTFRATAAGCTDTRVATGVGRLIARLSDATGMPIGLGVAQATPSLTVTCAAAGGDYPSLEDDESYTLTVTPTGATLAAATTYGALHGLETFRQLVDAGPNGYRAPAIRIVDAPRFPWRGILMDVSRHWMPPEVVRRNLDAMAAVKMNVLHWHLADDQGFRVESRVLPKLHELGSDGLYYTQEQVREIVEYARVRGIRIVPEFDVPGHTASWLVGYPELAGAPGPYTIQRRFGVFDPVLDPTRDEVYDFLDRFIGEMAPLFPDAWFHIGGDEVNGRQWNGSPRIKAYMSANGLRNTHDLQVHFNKRLSAIVRKHGRKMAGWEEIAHPDLPKDIVVQSWMGQKSLGEAAKSGHGAILSSGWYLDHLRSAAYIYGVDPLGESAATLTAAEKSRVLGGEGAMWAEFVNAETVDSRIWPRAAAIAERLWSPATVTDVDDMYRRLDISSRRLDRIGPTHLSSYRPMLARLAGTSDIGPLETLSDALEPAGHGTRSRGRANTTMLPLDRLVDATRAESRVSRAFDLLVDGYLADRANRAADLDRIERQLRIWQANHEAVAPAIRASFRLREAEPASIALRDAAAVGLEAVARLRAGTQATAAQAKAQTDTLERAQGWTADVRPAMIPAIRKLVDATSTGR